MALKIISAAEPVVVETLVLTFYAPPGVGKTSLAFTAAAPLLLDTDRGVHRSANRKDSVRPQTWDDIAGISASDVRGYKTLILDTAGRALDLLAVDIIKTTPKYGRGGALTLQGYGELKSRFAAYLNLMRSFGLDVILIAHSDEQSRNDEIIERIDMQGSSKQEVYKSCDAMARLGFVDGRRVLNFSPTETRFGKDPAGIGAIEVPDFAREPLFLAGIIQRIKDTLNAESATQAAAAQAAAEWAATVAAAQTADDFTDLIAQAPDRRAKVALHEAATAKGFRFDKDTGRYAPPAAAATVAAAAPAPEPAAEAAPAPDPAQVDAFAASNGRVDGLPY